MLSALLKSLSKEESCLTRLSAALELQGQALRRMDSAALEIQVHSIQHLSAEHERLRREGRRALQALSPGAHQLSAVEGPEIAAARERLRALAERLLKQRQENQAFASTAQELLARSLQRLKPRGGYGPMKRGSHAQ